MSPRSTTRPLYFWCFVSNSAFFKWHIFISEAKWTFMPFVLASSIASFLLLTFVKFHARIFSNLSHSLSTAAFDAGIFIAWGKEKMYQIVMLWWILSCFLQYGPHKISVEILPYAVLWIHKLPRYTQILNWSLVLPRFAPCWLFLLVLQDVAGATGVSNYF